MDENAEPSYGWERKNLFFLVRLAEFPYILQFYYGVERFEYDSSIFSILSVFPQIEMAAISPKVNLAQLAYENPSEFAELLRPCADIVVENYAHLQSIAEITCRLNEDTFTVKTNNFGGIGALQVYCIDALLAHQTFPVSFLKIRNFELDPILNVVQFLSASTENHQCPSPQQLSKSFLIFSW